MSGYYRIVRGACSFCSAQHRRFCRKTHCATARCKPKVYPVFKWTPERTGGLFLLNSSVLPRAVHPVSTEANLRV